MNYKILVLLIPFCIPPRVTIHAQDSSSYKHMFRLYVDDDYINLIGKGTDEAYTGGLRFDYFYEKSKTGKFFIDRWMPKAGNNAVNNFGWTLMQMIYTPTNLAQVPPAVNDYRYAGGLFAMHSLYSYNRKKKYGIQTEALAGIMGPGALAGPTQAFVHRLIHDHLPKGWDYQLPGDILLNLNLTVEKMIVQVGDVLEFFGSGRAAFGTMEDGLSIFTELRAGIMKGYFTGFINQYTHPRTKKRIQFYAFIKPGVECLAYYSLVDGGLFSRQDDYYNNPYTPAHQNVPFLSQFNEGLALSIGKIALTVTQQTESSMLRHVTAHSVGNGTLYISW